MRIEKEPTDFGKLFAESNHSHYGLVGRIKSWLQRFDKHVDCYRFLYGTLGAVLIFALLLFAIFVLPPA